MDGDSKREWFHKLVRVAHWHYELLEMDRFVIFGDYFQESRQRIAQELDRAFERAAEASEHSDDDLPVDPYLIASQN